MKNYANAAGQRALRTVTGFTTGQKTITALALLAVILGGSFFYKWAATPTYAPLFSNLSGTDASAIVDKLSADGTPYQLTDGGSTITVPQESVYAERIKMSGQGLPSGDTTGYALLDKQGLTTSQFQQTVDYQRAVEGELEKTINSIDGVRSAIVHLAIPQQSVFTSDTAKPTASVLISTQPGVTMTSQQVQSVTNLVSAAVPGMAANGVSVSDSTGRVLTSVGATGTTAGGAGDTRAQMTADYESRTTTQLQDMVDRLVGPGHAVVQVTADLDYDQTQTTTESFTAEPSVPPLADSSSKETYTGAAASAAGILGPTGVVAPGTTTPGTSYTKQSLVRNNAVGRTVEQRTAAPGAVRKLNVGILLDTGSAAKVDLTALKALVSSSVGIDPTRGDTIQVTSLAFDQATQKAAAAQVQQAASAASQASLFGLVRTVFLGLLVLVVLALAFLSMRGRRGSMLTDEDRLSIEALQRELENPEPESERRAGAPLIWRQNDRDAAMEHQPSVREEIGHLVERQPDEVAELLRGWLADRRG